MCLTTCLLEPELHKSEKSSDSKDSIFIQCLKKLLNQSQYMILSQECVREIDEFYEDQKQKLVSDKTNIEQIQSLVLDERKIWALYPSARWFLGIFISVFEEEFGKFILLCNAADNKKSEENKNYITNSFVEKIQRITISRLLEELKAHICDLNLDVINALSAERYESADSKDLNLLILPYPIAPERIDGILLFKENVSLEFTIENIHAIRKQLNMSKDACLVIGYCNGKHSICTVGIGPKTLARCFPQIIFTAHMEWAFCLPCQSESDNKTPGCRLRYEGGRYLLPILNLDEAERRKVQKALHIKGKQLDAMMKMLKTLKKKAKKGAIVIISDSETIQLEVDRLCKTFQRGYAFAEQELLVKGKRLIKRVSFPIVEKKLRIKKQVLRIKPLKKLVLRIKPPVEEFPLKQMISIDGALFVDLETNCWACGVILDGEACKEGDMARGARFNSSNNYLKFLQKRHPEAPLLGVVISEDGMIDWLPRN